MCPRLGSDWPLRDFFFCSTENPSSYNVLAAIVVFIVAFRWAAVHFVDDVATGAGCGGVWWNTVGKRLLNVLKHLGQDILQGGEGG